jgi:hypothetical protein
MLDEEEDGTDEHPLGLFWEGRGFAYHIIITYSFTLYLQLDQSTCFTTLSSSSFQQSFYKVIDVSPHPLTHT